ncbi:hypothetical protein PIB30_059311 [Stylosanthes scabra]|uniref:Uncharacterized protein n=1 Tax=Stylosanthes scabra TaxID=79078 RepID=A0ABU6XLG1_9FABA|nr:hypothetical protein [Stylosanthes scabra]
MVVRPAWSVRFNDGDGGVVPSALMMRQILMIRNNPTSVSNQVVPLKSGLSFPRGKMGSRVVFYMYKALKEYDDIDVEPTAELGTIKRRRYHFKDEKFTCSVHSGRFDPDRPYEFPITMLGGDCLFSAPRSTPSSNVMPPRAPRVGPSSLQPLPTKDSMSLGFSLRAYSPHDWKAARTWSSPSQGSDFIAPSEGWMCDGDETKVEETHGLVGVKPEGSKGKELVEEELEEEDPEEDSDESQSMDTSAESDFLKFLMGDTKPIYSSSSSCLTIESHGSNPSSGYPTSSASLQSGSLSGTWSSSYAPSQ